MKIIILIGIPASGKSTWIKKNYPNSVVISNDIVVEEIAKLKGVTYDDVMNNIEFSTVIKECRKRFDAAVKNKEEIIIIDNTNLTPKVRRKYTGKGYEREAVVFQIDEAERKARLEKRSTEEGKSVPQHIIEQMQASFTYPKEDENFKSIILITS